MELSLRERIFSGENVAKANKPLIPWNLNNFKNQIMNNVMINARDS